MRLRLMVTGAMGLVTALCGAGEATQDGAQAEQIATLCQQLGESQYGSQGACEQLIAIGEPAVPALIKALKDKRPQARWWAVAAVCRIGAEEGFAPAVEVLRKDPSSFVRSTAVYYMRHFRKKGKDVWPAVREALDDTSPEVGRWALRLMVEDRYEGLDEVLRKLLADAHPELQSYALLHVREIAERDRKKAQGYLPLVPKLVKAENERLRYDAIHTHVVLMDEGQLEFLRKTYENAKSPVEQEAAVRCGTILPDPPVEVIELFLMGLTSEDEKVREAAAAILRKGCKQYFGFGAKQPLPAREAAVEKWGRWYLRNKAKLQWHADLRKFLLPGQRQGKAVDDPVSEPR